MNLYISNLGPEVTPDSLALVFSTYGRVRSATISREASEPEGLACIDMPDAGEARAASRRLDGKVINGRHLAVHEGRPDWTQTHPAGV
jgi:RNA recognition motif-containing protein